MIESGASRCISAARHPRLPLLASTNARAWSLTTRYKVIDAASLIPGPNVRTQDGRAWTSTPAQALSTLLIRQLARHLCRGCLRPRWKLRGSGLGRW